MAYGAFEECGVASHLLGECGVEGETDGIVEVEGFQLAIDQHGEVVIEHEVAQCGVGLAVHALEVDALHEGFELLLGTAEYQQQGAPPLRGNMVALHKRLGGHGNIAHGGTQPSGYLA